MVVGPNSTTWAALRVRPILFSFERKTEAAWSDSYWGIKVTWSRGGKHRDGCWKKLAVLSLLLVSLQGLKLLCLGCWHCMGGRSCWGHHGVEELIVVGLRKCSCHWELGAAATGSWSCCNFSRRLPLLWRAKLVWLVKILLDVVMLLRLLSPAVAPSGLEEKCCLLMMMRGRSGKEEKDEGWVVVPLSPLVAVMVTEGEAVVYSFFGWKFEGRWS